MEEIQNEQDPLRKAELIKKLHLDSDVTYHRIAEGLGVSPTYISNYLRLLRLPTLVLDGYYSGIISLTHLFILSRIKNHDQVIALYEHVLEKNMSALDAEEAVRNILYNTISDGDPVGVLIKNNLEKKYKNIMQDAQVKIIQTRVKVKLLVELKGNRVKTNEFLNKIAEE